MLRARVEPDLKQEADSEQIRGTFWSVGAQPVRNFLLGRVALSLSKGRGGFPLEQGIFLITRQSKATLVSQREEVCVIPLL